MWITGNGQQVLVGICNNNQLDEKEQDAVAKYNGFEEIRKLDPNNKGPASYLIDKIQKILKKYANYTDPLED